MIMDYKHLSVERTTADKLNMSSCHCGSVKIRFKHLKDTLGYPDKGSGDGKSQYQWFFRIKTNEGDIFYCSLYDYKEPVKIYDDLLVEWHIGGFKYSQESLFRDWLEYKFNRSAPHERIYEEWVDG